MSRSARIPTQYKSPFEIDARRVHEMSSPHAGLLATSRAFRSLGTPGLMAAHLQLQQRQVSVRSTQETFCNGFHS